MVFSHIYSIHTLPRTCRPTVTRCTREGLMLSVMFIARYPTLRTVGRVLLQAYLRVRHQWQPSAGDGDGRPTHDLVAFNQWLRDYRSNDRRPYLKFSLWRRHWTANKTTIKEWWTILLVECVYGLYAPYRETNSPPTFIPSLQHEGQTCHVLCYRWLQRIGLLVPAALRHPAAIMVQCMRVNATFKHRRAASFFDVCSQNRRQLFSLHRCDVCAVSVLVSKHFSDTDTESIPAVSADTEYPMPVSVSP